MPPPRSIVVWCWCAAALKLEAGAFRAPEAAVAATRRPGQAADVATDVPRPLETHLFAINDAVIGLVKGAIDDLYATKDIERFYVLETVARVPYFAYTSVLHLRETLGDRAGRDRLQTHYAEADNELHHLLIMEALGGDRSPVDRAFAHSLACVFYWYAVFAYAAAPRFAYHLSELIEAHAYKTYDAYLKRNEADLRRRPVPEVAKTYYELDNPYLFDLCHTATPRRRPKLKSLYDVFVNVRDDEKTHWATLCSLVQYDRLSPGGHERQTKNRRGRPSSSSSSSSSRPRPLEPTRPASSSSTSSKQATETLKKFPLLPSLSWQHNLIKQPHSRSSSSSSSSSGRRTTAANATAPVAS